MVLVHTRAIPAEGVHTYGYPRRQSLSLATRMFGAETRRAAMSGPLTPLATAKFRLQMVLELPHLRDAIDNERNYWLPDVPGLHVRYDDILVPAIQASLWPGASADLRARLFDFVERMASSLEMDVVNVVEVTMCESLLVVPQARKLYGAQYVSDFAPNSPSTLGENPSAMARAEMASGQLVQSRSDW